MPLNREREALSVQNLYLPRDAIYAQNDSKDRGRIEHRYWSNVQPQKFIITVRRLSSDTRDMSHAR